MKKLTAVLMLGFVILVGTAPAFAATASNGPISMSAAVDSTLTLSVELRKNDFSGAVVTSMDFGKLINTGTGTLRSSTTSTTGTGAVRALIIPNSHGVPYVISQTGTALSNGTTTLPAGACVVTPVYIAADNAGAAKPAGATVGSAGSWVGTRTLYTSESGTASARAIDAFYSISDDPDAGSTASVPLDQAGGTYTGNVTITVTA